MSCKFPYPRELPITWYIGSRWSQQSCIIISSRLICTPLQHSDNEATYASKKQILFLILAPELHSYICFNINKNQQLRNWGRAFSNGIQCIKLTESLSRKPTWMLMASMSFSWSNLGKAQLSQNPEQQCHMIQVVETHTKCKSLDYDQLTIVLQNWSCNRQLTQGNHWPFEIRKQNAKLSQTLWGKLTCWQWYMDLSTLIHRINTIPT